MEFEDLILGIVDNCQDPAQILPSLYLSSYGPPRSLQTLKSLGITRIINCTAYDQEYQEYQCENHFPENFEYFNIDLIDHQQTDISVNFDQFYNLVQTGQTVLVHCLAGRSRSVTLILSYLIKRFNLSLRQSINYVKSRRPQIGPNFGFIEQLLKFQTSIRSQPSFSIVQYVAQNMYGMVDDKCTIQEFQKKVSAVYPDYWDAVDYFLRKQVYE